MSAERHLCDLTRSPSVRLGLMQDLGWNFDGLSLDDFYFFNRTPNKRQGCPSSQVFTVFIYRVITPQSLASSNVLSEYILNESL